MSTDIEDHIDNYLYYEEGKLFWKNRSSSYKYLNGKQAGHFNKDGYNVVSVKCRYIYAHRIVFFMHYRYWPEQIDHFDRDSSNNKIENLRECSNSENGRNRGEFKNQSIYGRNIKKSLNGKFQVMLTFNGRKVSFGNFADLELAQLVASEAREKYYGEWAYDY